MRKNFIKYLVVIVALACLLTQCDLFKQGGTIVITNNYNGINYVTVVEATKAVQELASFAQGKGKLLDKKGASYSFDFDKDGFYAVIWLLPTPNFKAVAYLSGGSTVRDTAP